jgi:hypothetical protein
MAKKKFNTGLQHYLLFLLLVGSLSYVFYDYVIPSAVKGAVVSLFGPQGGGLHLIDGVIAEPAKEPAKGSSHEMALPAGETLKNAIKSEYIFDFSSKVRTSEKDGYDKISNEFILRAPALGEAAIVLEAPLAFSVLALLIGGVLSILITIFLPSSIGLFSNKIEREIHHTATKIRLQTGFSDETVNVLTLPTNQLNAQDRDYVEGHFQRVWDRTQPPMEELESRKRIGLHDLFSEETNMSEFRDLILYDRIHETFSNSVKREIVDTKAARLYSNNKLRILDGLRLYMTHHFTHQYSNNVTGAAYLGAAILIVIIGVRGLKFIPATKPSLILAAISLEGFLLALLGFSLLYTAEEEPMDNIMKKVEDASRGQLETLKEQQKDMHKMAGVLVEGTVQLVEDRVSRAIKEYFSSNPALEKRVGEEIASKIFQGLRGSQESK